MSQTKKLKKMRFAGGGAVVQLLGVALTLTLFGAIIGIPLFIIGSSMSRYYICGACGNEVVKESSICPICKSQFH